MEKKGGKNAGKWSTTDKHEQAVLTEAVCCWLAILGIMVITRAVHSKNQTKSKNKTILVLIKSVLENMRPHLLTITKLMETHLCFTTGTRRAVPTWAARSLQPGWPPQPPAPCHQP